MDYSVLSKYCIWRPTLLSNSFYTFVIHFNLKYITHFLYTIIHLEIQDLLLFFFFFLSVMYFIFKVILLIYVSMMTLIVIDGEIKAHLCKRLWTEYNCNYISKCCGNFILMINSRNLQLHLNAFDIYILVGTFISLHQFLTNVSILWLLF